LSTNQTSIFAVGVDADEVRGLAEGVAGVGLNEFFEVFGELLHLGLDG